MIKNQIVPEIEVVEKYNFRKKQKANFHFKGGFKIRTNNRKTNKCRKVQVIKFVTDSWPPILVTRNIKTFK